MTSYLRRVSQLVSTVLKLKPERILAGEDLQGNKYYEVFPQRYFFGLLRNSRHIRYVEPRGLTIRPQAVSVKVTKEWEAWLRKRRKDPPTFEELEENINNYDLIQERVRHLNEQVRIKKLQKKDISKMEEQSVDSWSEDKR